MRRLATGPRCYLVDNIRNWDVVTNLDQLFHFGRS